LAIIFEVDVYMKDTIIKRHDRYNVDDTWRKVKPSNPKDFLKRFIKLTYSGHAIECHGASQDWGCILSSLDIHSRKKNIPIELRKTKETMLLETFAKKADTYFPSGERRLIEVANLKWKTFRNTGTVFVGRHYGLPTRCVDWTGDPFIALFFACQRDHDKSGVVWWMDYKNFSDAIASQWMPFYGKKKNIEDDFEKDFVDGNDKNILVRFHYPDWMDRPTKQKAWITLSGRFDIHHDEAIHRLGVRKCGRLIIRPEMKSYLLNKLDRWGINNTMLGISNSQVKIIANEIADKVFS